MTLKTGRIIAFHLNTTRILCKVAVAGEQELRHSTGALGGGRIEVCTVVAMANGGIHLSWAECEPGERVL